MQGAGLMAGGSAIFRRAVQSAPRVLKADRDDPVDNDALGRAREGPRSKDGAPGIDDVTAADYATNRQSFGPPGSH
jgi:hypothetical protein